MMRLLVISLGLLLVLTVIGVAVLPQHIQWAQYRQDFKQAIEAFTGYRAEITGDISLKILPKPHATISGLNLSGHGEQAIAPFLKVEAIEAELSLLSLLRGTAQVTNLELTGPDFDMRRFFTATPVETADEQQHIALGLFGETSLDHVRVSGGRLSFGHIRPEQSVVLDQINVTMVAESLRGPMTAKGAFSWYDRPMSFDLSVGRLNDAGTVPVNLKAKSEGDRLSLSYGGVLAARKELDMQGDVSVQAESLEVFLAHLGMETSALNTSQPVNTQLTLTAKDKAVRLDNIRLSMGKGVFEGKIHIKGPAIKGENPSVQADVKLKDMTLDMPLRVSPDLLAMPSMFKHMDMEWGMGAENLTIGKMVFNSLDAKINTREGALSIDRFNAQSDQGAAITLAGRTDFTSQTHWGMTMTGDHLSADLKRMQFDWPMIDPAKFVIDQGKLSLSGHRTDGKTVIKEAVFEKAGATHIKGSGTFDGARKSFKLQGKMLDLKDLGLDIKQTELLGLMGDVPSGGALQIDADIDAVTLADVAWEDVVFKGRIAEGQARIEHFAASGFYDADVKCAGTVDYQKPEKTPEKTFDLNGEIKAAQLSRTFEKAAMSAYLPFPVGRIDAVFDIKGHSTKADYTISGMLEQDNKFQLKGRFAPAQDSAEPSHHLSARLSGNVLPIIWTGGAPVNITHDLYLDYHKADDGAVRVEKIKGRLGGIQLTGEGNHLTMPADGNAKAVLTLGGAMRLADIKEALLVASALAKSTLLDMSIPQLELDAGGYKLTDVRAEVKADAGKAELLKMAAKRGDATLSGQGILYDGQNDTNTPRMDLIVQGGTIADWAAGLPISGAIERADVSVAGDGQTKGKIILGAGQIDNIDLRSLKQRLLMTDAIVPVTDMLKAHFAKGQTAFSKGSATFDWGDALVIDALNLEGDWGQMNGSGTVNPTQKTHKIDAEFLLAGEENIPLVKAGLTDQGVQFKDVTHLQDFITKRVQDRLQKLLDAELEGIGAE